MAEDKTTETLISSLIEHLRGIVGIAGAITGLSYLVGYIIVNIYLSKFGIHNLELIKSKYLASGLLYLSLSFLLAAVPVITVGLLRERSAGLGALRKWHTLMLLVANLILAATFVWTFSVILTGVEPPESSVLPVNHRRGFIWFFLPASQLALWFPIVLGSAISPLLDRIRPYEGRRSVNSTPGRLTMNLRRRAASIGLAAIFAIISLYVFATWVYPHVSPTLGGGAPSRVQILLSKSGSETIMRLPVTVVDNLSEPIVLLDQTDSSFLLLLGSRQIVELSSQAVIGVVHSPP